MQLQRLTCEEVLRIYSKLVADFYDSGDPIAPAGVKSMDLLESAVMRQHTGHGETLKYPSPIDNAATLLYGICCDHPFYNGNKRTALVSTLVHLDKNKLTLYHTSQQDLYNLMLDVADHTITGRPDKRARNPKPRKHADDEVAAIAKWLAWRAHKVTKGERLVTYRELRRILEQFGYYLTTTKGSSIDIVKYETKTKGFINRQPVKVSKKIGNIGWPGESREVGISEIKRIREICRLTEDDGVDSDAFYFSDVVIDSFVNRYRKLLNRLAKV